jgi:hypothetical protein
MPHLPGVRLTDYRPGLHNDSIFIWNCKEYSSLQGPINRTDDISLGLRSVPDDCVSQCCLYSLFYITNDIAVLTKVPTTSRLYWIGLYETRINGSGSSMLILRPRSVISQCVWLERVCTPTYYWPCDASIDMNG